MNIKQWIDDRRQKRIARAVDRVLEEIARYKNIVVDLNAASI
jgi:hypothetical protein